MLATAPMPIPADAITGLVLAGGRGLRMGGLDKGLQMLRGKPLVVHMLERLAPQTGALIVSANRHLDEYAALGAPWRAWVLADDALDNALTNALADILPDALPDPSPGALPALLSGSSSSTLLPGSLANALPDLSSCLLPGALPDLLSGALPGSQSTLLSGSLRGHSSFYSSRHRHSSPGASAGLPWPDQAIRRTQQPRFDGPLAGLLTGLRAAQTGWLLSVPCDSPYLCADLAERLGAALDAQRADIATARTVGVHGASSESGLHPVFALLRTALADDLAACVARGERKVRAWYARHKTVEVVFTDERAFYNANSLRDLADLESA